MRRFFTYLAAITLSIGSLAVGTVTADLPFWRRVFDLPLAPGETFLPVAIVGVPAAGLVTERDPAQNSIPMERLDAAAALARRAGGSALLVTHRGRLQLEVYPDGDRNPFRLRPADFLARPLAAIATGLALADGKLVSLDERVSKFLPEWEGDPRGAITVRQLLDETSGLETGVDAAQVLGARPFADLPHLADFATSRGVRLSIGNDFERTALGFRLEHEPGGFFHVSPANTQLAAVIVARVTGIPYDRYLDARLFAKLPFHAMSMQFDRSSGMPAAHCCVRSDARNVLRFAELLRNDGEIHDAARTERVLPAGWVAQMRKGSRANPDFGLQIERRSLPSGDLWHLGGAHGGAIWIVPAEQLSVVWLAERALPVPEALPGLLLDPGRK